MILITSAYPAETKELKKLIKVSGLTGQVSYVQFSPENQGLTKDSLLNTKISIVINAGFAGSLNPKLAFGEVVMIKEVMVKRDGKLAKLDVESNMPKIVRTFARESKVGAASLLTVEEPVTDMQVRDKLREETGADIVDMEGYYFSKAAKVRGLPFVSFKVVSDNADNDAWQNIKQYSERWSKILAKTVFDFIESYLDS